MDNQSNTAIDIDLSDLRDTMTTPRMTMNIGKGPNVFIVVFTIPEKSDNMSAIRDMMKVQTKLMPYPEFMSYDATFVRDKGASWAYLRSGQYNLIGDIGFADTVTQLDESMGGENWDIKAIQKVLNNAAGRPTSTDKELQQDTMFIDLDMLKRTIRPMTPGTKTSMSIGRGPDIFVAIFSSNTIHTWKMVADQSALLTGAEYYDITQSGSDMKSWAFVRRGAFALMGNDEYMIVTISAPPVGEDGDRKAMRLTIEGIEIRTQESVQLFDRVRYDGSDLTPLTNLLQSDNYGSGRYGLVKRGEEVVLTDRTVRDTIIRAGDYLARDDDGYYVQDGHGYVTEINPDASPTVKGGSFPSGETDQPATDQTTGTYRMGDLYTTMALPGAGKTMLGYPDNINPCKDIPIREQFVGRGRPDTSSPEYLRNRANAFISAMMDIPDQMSGLHTLKTLQSHLERNIAYLEGRMPAYEDVDITRMEKDGDMVVLFRFRGTGWNKADMDGLVHLYAKGVDYLMLADPDDGRGDIRVIVMGSFLKY